jgi:hypothetical protein
VLVTVNGGNNDPLTEPIISPPTGIYQGPQVVVTITNTSPGSKIYYTTTGNIPKVGTSFTKEYLGPFTLLQKTTVRAVSVKAGLDDSPVAVSFIQIENPGIVATPVISPGAGTYEGSISVSISSATSGAEIWYTTNGNNPRFDVPNSFTKLYTGPFTLFGTTTVKAVGLKSGLANSAMASANFVVNNPAIVAAPTFSPAPGIYASKQSVTISSSTSGVKIYFTNNGITPSNTTAAARLYTGPISVGSNQQLKAIAYKEGFQPSVISVGNYTIGPVRIATEYAGSPYYFENMDAEDMADQDAMISIFPNPTSGKATIRSNFGHGTLTVFNTLGQKIFSSEIDGSASEIDLSDYPTGLYSIQFVVGNSRIVKNLVKQ